MTERLGSQMKQRLQENLNLQRVETLALIWTERRTALRYGCHTEELLQNNTIVYLCIGLLHDFGMDTSTKHRI